MKIALGTANFGQKYGLSKKNIKSNKKIKKILKFSNNSNIKLIDTSDNYGSSEALLGKNNLKDFKVITKLKISDNEKKSDNLENIIFEKIEQSLFKLNIKKLYAILLHNSNDLKGNKKYKLIKILKKLKKKNLVSKIGISIYDPKELDFIWPFWKPDIVQCPFNIVDKRIYESGWLNRLKKNKIEIHVRSIFLQGLLLKNEKSIPKKFKKWENIFKELNSYCDDENILKIQVCINFIKSFKKISYVVIGFENILQIKKIIKYFNNKKKKYPSLICGDAKLINPQLW
jgi:aryl-alcohol dehydrogenase-like predicted oxidoreductase|tara:strand:- start:780 stop:1637 length:858 start_codon:yes stop_codon:yes gene_type:complete